MRDDTKDLLEYELRVATKCLEELDEDLAEMVESLRNMHTCDPGGDRHPDDPECRACKELWRIAGMRRSVAKVMP